METEWTESKLQSEQVNETVKGGWGLDCDMLVNAVNVEKEPNIGDFWPHYLQITFYTSGLPL
jgi:hypothetical protein